MLLRDVEGGSAAAEWIEYKITLIGREVDYSLENLG